MDAGWARGRPRGGLSLRLDATQCIGGGEDGDVLEGLEIEQIQIARDDEIGARGECASEYVIVIGIAAGGLRQRLRLDEVSEPTVILDVLGGGQAGELDAVRELIARNDLGELGQQDETGIQRHRASACQVDQATRRTAPEQARQDGVGISNDAHERHSA